jgi:acyl-CoA synthetase (AMP-forming)/AMP-acid ligase II
MLIGDLVTRAARWYPDKEAVVFEDTRLTYQQFNERVNRLANALVGMGAKKGDRIAIICHNSNHFAEAFFAIAKIGAVSTNLNWRLSPK